MQRKLLRYGGAVVVIALLAVGCYLVYAQLSLRFAEAAFEEWTTERRAEGYEVAVGAVAVSGMPGAIVFDIEDFEIAKPSDPLAWRWYAPRILSTAGGRGGAVAMSVVGLQTLRYRADGETRTLSFGGERFQASFEPGVPEQPARLVLEANRFLFARPGEEPDLTASRLRIQLALGDGSGLVPNRSTLGIRADDVVLPDQRRAPLGDTIEAFELEAYFFRPVPPAQTLAAAIGAWRDDRGHLEISRIRLLWGTLNARGNGRLSVDDALRPYGNIRTIVRDHLTMIDALQAGGVLDNEEMANVRAIMLFLQANAGGEVSLPVEFIDGEVRVGPAILGTVKPLLPAP